jgi:HAD superfamily hydrolase (TIGR01509 family)
MIRAILFDSDGVLVDTERMFFEATREAFEWAGVPLAASQWARWYLADGKRSREVADLVGIAPPLVEPALARRDRLFWARVEQGVPVLPGVAEALAHLAADFRLAVVTGASRRHYQRVHSATELARFFELVVAQDDYESPKPNPQAYLTALERLGLNAAQCVAVEDSPRGANAAVAAGIRCFVVPTRWTALPPCPAGCHAVENLTLLKEAIEEL